MEVSDAFRVLGKQLSNIFERYHFMLFFVACSIGLATATFLLFQIITAAPDDPEPSTSSTFDTKTIERIQKLNSNTPAPQSTPTGGSSRTNPF